MLKGKKKISILFLAIASVVTAQDIHFSQFYESPLLLNPAQAGAMNADIRLACNYKNQWKSVLNPFNTMAVAVDTKMLKTGKGGSNYLGVGITAYSDKAGKSSFSTQQANAVVAYNVRPSNNSNFSAGIDAGFFQKNININNLRWDAQYDGKYYDASLPTGELSSFQRIFKFDLGAGVLWRYYDRFSSFRLDIGGSATHLTQPKISFYKKDPTLNMKYLGQINAQIRIPDKAFYVSPQFLYVSQGPYNEIIAGSIVKYVIGEDTRDHTLLNTFALVSSTFELGVFYRFKDAIIFTTAIEYKRVISIGFSYDMNISKLKVASKLRGGMEFSLVYKGFFSGKPIGHHSTD